MKMQYDVWIASMIMILSLSSRVLADTVNWSGYGATARTGASWNDSTNWSGGKLPGSVDIARFGFTNNMPATAKTFSLDAPQTVGQVQFPAYGNIPALTIGSASDIAAGNTLTLSSFFRDVNNGNSQTIAANVILSTNSVWDVRNGYNGNVTVSGSISGIGKGLIKTGNNTLTLSGANIYTGDTVIQGGALVLQGTNSYTGDTVVGNAGTLTLNFNAAPAPLTNIINNASALKMGTTATVSLSGKNAANAKNSQTFNGVTFNSGSSAFSIANGIASGSTIVDIGAINRTAGSTVNFSQPTVNASISAVNGYSTSSGNGTSGILGSYATVAAADWAMNNGVNIVAYTGYMTLVGDLPTIADNALSNVRISNASTGMVSLAAGGTTTINTLLDKDTASRTNIIGSGNTLRLGALGGIMTSSGTGPLLIDVAGSAGTLTAGGADNTAGELIINNATTITNNAVIADNGTGAVTLTKSGGGTLVLNTPCTHTGGTFLNAGSLLLPGGSNPLATNGVLSIAAGTFNLGGAVQTNRTVVSILGGIVTNGTIIALGSNYRAQAGAVTAILGGSAGLDKSTWNTLNLMGANTYTGDTTVAEGVLVAGYGSTDTISVPGNLIVGSPNGLISASVTTTGGKPFNGAKSFTVYNNGSLSFGAAAQSFSGTLTLIGGSFTGNQPYFQNSAKVYMTGGSFGGSIYIGSFSITSYSNATPALVSAYLAAGDHVFTVNRGSGPIDLNFTGSMNDTKTLTKAGNGVMVSSGANMHSATLVTAGTLLINGTNGKAAVTVSAGATLGGVGVIGGSAGSATANLGVTGAVGNLATVAPGRIDTVTGNHVIGTLTVGSASQTNNVTFGSYSKLQVKIDAAGNCDKLVVNGTLSVATATDTLEMNVEDVNALKPATYTLVTFQQRAAGADQEFTTVVGKPTRGRLEYTATSLNYVIDPKGTLIRIQ